MFKSTAALCLCLVMGVTATTRPAEADEDLLGQLVFGAVAAGLAYQLLRDQDDKPRATAQRAPVQRNLAHGGPTRRNLNRAPDWSPREKRRACQQVLPTPRGNVRFIADRCLNHPRAKSRVPQACLQDRWMRGQVRQVYSRRCLAQFGQVR